MRQSLCLALSASCFPVLLSYRGVRVCPLPFPQYSLVFLRAWSLCPAMLTAPPPSAFQFRSLAITLSNPPRSIHKRHLSRRHSQPTRPQCGSADAVPVPIYLSPRASTRESTVPRAAGHLARRPPRLVPSRVHFSSTGLALSRPSPALKRSPVPHADPFACIRLQGRIALPHARPGHSSPCPCRSCERCRRPYRDGSRYVGR